MHKRFEEMTTPQLLNIINLKSKVDYTHDEICKARAIFAEITNAESVDPPDETTSPKEEIPNEEMSTSKVEVSNEEIPKLKEDTPSQLEEYSTDIALAAFTAEGEDTNNHAPGRVYKLYTYIVLPATILWAVAMLFVSVAVVSLNYSFSLNIYVLSAFLYAFIVSLAWYGILNFTSWSFVLNRALILSRIFAAALRIFGNQKDILTVVLEAITLLVCMGLLYGLSKIRQKT